MAGDVLGLEVAELSELLVDAGVDRRVDPLGLDDVDDRPGAGEREEGEEGDRCGDPDPDREAGPLATSRAGRHRVIKETTEPPPEPLPLPLPPEPPLEPEPEP